MHVFVHVAVRCILGFGGPNPGTGGLISPAGMKIGAFEGGFGS